MPELCEGPLTGIRVVEFGHVAAGPFASMLLADLGADVVKVEPPAGDPMRRWPPLVADGSSRQSLNFASVNRSKRTAVLDLKSPEGMAMALGLVAEADVLIENHRPGALERLGLGYGRVTKDHARGLIYCSISGFGSASPKSKTGAYDVIVQAESGLMSVTGEANGPPVKCGVPVGDFVAALYASLTISAALRDRERTGTPRSVYLDCSMFHCLLAISALQTSEYWGTGKTPQRLGTAHPRNAPYQCFPAADTMIAVAAGNDELWKRLCGVLGMSELVTDMRFLDQPRRAANQEELYRLLAPVFISRPAEQWLTKLAEAGIPSGRVNSFADVLADKEALGADFVLEQPLPGGTRTNTTAYPVKSSGWAQRPAGPPPILDPSAALAALRAWKCTVSENTSVTAFCPPPPGAKDES